MKNLFLFLFLSTFFVVESQGGEATIIKVRGNYGIINKGANQGFFEGQILQAKLETTSGLIEVGKVKVIRATANRAAVKLISKNNNFMIKKGDRLYASFETKSTTIQYKKSVKEMNVSQSLSKTKEEIIKGSYHTNDEIPLPKVEDFHTTNSSMTNPWLSFEMGSVVPKGNLRNGFSPSFRLGASYMVSTGPHLNLGIEINNTFLNSPHLANGNIFGVKNLSASILEGLIIFQSFIAPHVFIEVGGGLYRPKVRTSNLDDSENTFSSTKFGFFGGTGFFIPTSQYAGFLLKGRIHNYFDGNAKQYYGLTGGFRFKLYSYK